jgi:phosphoribosylformylglycinamidine synthase
VVGGNVSLYNESSGRDIDPTPIVGVLGLIDRLDRRPPGAGLVEGGRLLLLGETVPQLGGSLWALHVHGHRGGELPPLDLELHGRLITFVVDLVADGLAVGLHDVSDGGLAVALGEMAVRSEVGFRVAGIETHADLFAESPSRVVVCALPEEAQTVFRRAQEAGIPASFLGGSGGDRLSVEGLIDLGLSEARRSWRGAIPAALQPTA